MHTKYFFQSLQPDQGLLYLKIHEQALSPSGTLYLCFIHNIDVRSWFIIESEKSHSHVQLFGTPWTIVCQAPLSMGILQARILE